ncbi:ABC transporter ATP-binding protein [Senegalia sp. (in: firmicutes)]|uniref:ABC transporter ATP-binding protein n=1 Tax=Senegalia sp. (in: firmicutes) TaxID=1924098 RepID=UPI003F9CE9B5
MSKIILKTENLKVQYKDKVIIKNINLEIEEGKIYSVIGPNGCGKTTLLKSLTRAIKPKSGKVYLEGEDLYSMSTKSIARKVGVLSQGSNTLSDISVRELIAYGRYSHKNWWEGTTKEDKEIVDWAIERTSLKKLEHRKINTMSGGERQRAWIAMSIAQKPRLLLLDEPTTYLDISHQLEIMELVLSLNKEEGLTILMVLHDINHAARYSDELLVINNNTLYQQGDPWDILKGDVLKDVFRVEADISMDQDTKKPIFYAKKVI